MNADLLLLLVRPFSPLEDNLAALVNTVELVDETEARQMILDVNGSQRQQATQVSLSKTPRLGAHLRLSCHAPSRYRSRLATSQTLSHLVL